MFSVVKKSRARKTYLVILVHLIHAPLALLFRDNLTRVLHNDLVWLKAAIAADTITAITSLVNLDTNAIPAALLGSFLKILEGTVHAETLAEAAVCVIALVEHDAVLAVLAAPVFRLADTPRCKVLEVRSLLPVCGSISNKSV